MLYQLGNTGLIYNFMVSVTDCIKKSKKKKYILKNLDK